MGIFKTFSFTGEKRETRGFAEHYSAKPPITPVLRGEQQKQSKQEIVVQ